jgi:hypothetical protein
VKLCVRLTREDIRKGKRRNCYLCPWARAFDRAIRRVLPKLPRYHEGNSSMVEVNRDGSRSPWTVRFLLLGFEITLPPDISQQISDYEIGTTLVPQTYVANLGGLIKYSEYRN